MDRVGSDRDGIRCRRDDDERIRGQVTIEDVEMKAMMEQEIRRKRLRIEIDSA